MVVYKGRSGAASGKGTGGGQSYKKEEKKTTTSSGGWGMFDSIAKLSQTTDKKEQKKLEDQVNNASKQFGGGEKEVQQAITNAKTIASGGQTQGQKEVFTPTTTKIPPVKEVIKPKVKTFDIPGIGNVSEKLYKLYQTLKDRGYSDAQAKKIIKLGQTEEKWADENLVDLVSGEGIKRLITKDFGASKEYENEFLGSAGAENILNKLNSITDPKEKQEYVNRILKSNKGAEEIFGYPAAAGLDISPSEFEQKLREANQGNKNFDKNYYETAGDFWALNPASTQGDLDDMATAYQQGNLKMTKANTLAIQQAVDAKSKGQGLAGLGGGGGGGTPPVDPTPDPDAGLMPSGTYLASQFNKNLGLTGVDPYKNQSYMGGPEQNYIAGGYWDPNKHEWAGGSPWGTQNLWQGANPTEPPPPTTMAEGGPVRAPSSKVTMGGGGLFDFKPYGF